MDLYPLRFEPLVQDYPWGGRRLASALGKSVPAGRTAAESWEVCDRPQQQTCVAHGPLAGWELGRVRQAAGEQLLGRHSHLSRFPLLFKFLDARERLSVQVHPNDEMAARLDPPEVGKSEAWVVLEAEPGSVIYAGLKRGVDRALFERELARGTCELCLAQFEPRVGDCIVIPAGTVHALGNGLLVAEVQQPSDVTYRLFDWNRVGANGQPRPLHVAQGLEAINFDLPPAQLISGSPTGDETCQRLVTCDKFLVDRRRFQQPIELGGDQRAHVLAVLEGEVTAAGDLCGSPLGRGGTLLLPACCGTVRLTPHGPVTLLDCYLP